MNKIPREVIEAYQEEYMGKKIEFTDEKGERFVGICQYLDYNPIFQLGICRLLLIECRLEMLS